MKHIGRRAKVVINEHDTRWGGKEILYPLSFEARYRVYAPQQCEIGPFKKCRRQADVDCTFHMAFDKVCERTNVQNERRGLLKKQCLMSIEERYHRGAERTNLFPKIHSWNRGDSFHLLPFDGVITKRFHHKVGHCGCIYFEPPALDS